jgi:DNA-directed RNA polymerase subunit H (RpoH/RPB5)
MLHHIHLGAGALGLGLIIPAVSSQTTATTLIARNSKEKSHIISHLRSQKKYSVVSPEGKSWQVLRRISIIQETLPAIENGDTCLFTIAVKDGIRDPALLLYVYELISYLTNRFDNLFVCSCENAFSSEDLKESLENFASPYNARPLSELGVIFLETLSDRICNGPYFSKDLGEDHVNLSHLLGKGVTVVTSDEIIYARIKKIVILNLSHALISIWALRAGYTELHEYLRAEVKARIALHNIMIELISIVKSIYDEIDEHDLFSYAGSVEKRFQETEDTVFRIIKRFRGAEGISSFFKDIWYKGLKHFNSDYMEVSEFAKFPYVSASLHMVMELVASDSYVADS